MIEEIVRTTVCQIVNGKTTGTGFLIAPNRIITARHCIVNADSEENSIRALFSASTKYSKLSLTASVVADLEELDRLTQSTGARRMPSVQKADQTNGSINRPGTVQNLDQRISSKNGPLERHLEKTLSNNNSLLFESQVQEQQEI